MKQSGLLTLPIMILLACAQPKHTPKLDLDSISAEIIQMEKDSWVAWKNRDRSYFENFLSDDHIEIGASGVGDKNRVLATVEDKGCVVGEYRLENMRVVLLDEQTALLTYFAQQETMCNGRRVPSPAWTGSLYQKRNGKWVNVVYQQSPVQKQTN